MPQQRNMTKTQKINFTINLQNAIQKVPQHDRETLMGNLNAKIGGKNKGYEEIMGKHGVGILNNNDQRLFEFCQLNDLVMGGTLFEHKSTQNLYGTHQTANQKTKLIISAQSEDLDILCLTFGPIDEQTLPSEKM